jgi:hypothetical protein
MRIILSMAAPYAGRIWRKCLDAQIFFGDAQHLDIVRNFQFMNPAHELNAPILLGCAKLGYYTAPHLETNEYFFWGCAKLTAQRRIWKLKQKCAANFFRAYENLCNNVNQ